MDPNNNMSPAMSLMGNNGGGTIWGAPRTTPQTPANTTPVNTNPFYPQNTPYGSIPGSTGTPNTSPNTNPSGGFPTYNPGTTLPTSGFPTVSYTSTTPSTPSPSTTNPSTNNGGTLPGPIGGGARPSTWAADYDPTKGGFQWSDGTLHGSPQPAQGTPTIPDPNHPGQSMPNPNYVPPGPTTDVWGNALGSANWGKATLPSNGAAVSPFGPNPFITNAGYNAPGGFSGGYNPLYFPTQQTAQIAAGLIPGAQVIQGNAITNAPGSPIQQNQPNWLLQLPNGMTINPGFIADAYNHGYPQQYVDQLISSMINPTANLNSLDPITGMYAVSGGKATVQPSNLDGSFNPTTSFTSPYPMGAPANPSTIQTAPQSLQDLVNTLSGNQPVPTTTSTSPLTPSSDNTLAQILSLFSGIGSPSNNPFASLLSGSGLNSLGTNSNTMSQFAQLLNLFTSLRGGSNGTLNPLFWDSNGQVGQQSLYPSFY